MLVSITFGYDLRYELNALAGTDPALLFVGRGFHFTFHVRHLRTVNIYRSNAVFGLKGRLRICIYLHLVASMMFLYRIEDASVIRLFLLHRLHVRQRMLQVGVETVSVFIRDASSATMNYFCGRIQNFPPRYIDIQLGSYEVGSLPRRGVPFT